MDWGATRAQDLESRRRRGGGHERGDSRQKMFAVVEHEQHLLGTEMADQVPEDWTVNASRVLPTPPRTSQGQQRDGLVEESEPAVARSLCRPMTWVRGMGNDPRRGDAAEATTQEPLAGCMTMRCILCLISVIRCVERTIGAGNGPAR
jgi:hypothetical protein